MFRDQSRYIKIYHWGEGGDCHRLQRIKGDSRKFMGGGISYRFIGGDPSPQLINNDWFLS